MTCMFQAALLLGVAGGRSLRATRYLAAVDVQTSRRWGTLGVSRVSIFQLQRIISLLSPRSGDGDGRVEAIDAVDPSCLIWAEPFAGLGDPEERAVDGANNEWNMWHHWRPQA